jgi:hypothetical protein
LTVCRSCIAACRRWEAVRRGCCES